MIPENTHKSVIPHVQLAYVLPVESLHLIPDGVGKKLLEEKNECYKKNNKMMWAYCKFIWEAHMELPHIDLENLEKFVSEILVN